MHCLAGNVAKPYHFPGLTQGVSQLLRRVGTAALHHPPQDSLQRGQFQGCFGRAHPPRVQQRTISVFQPFAKLLLTGLTNHLGLDGGAHAHGACPPQQHSLGAECPLGYLSRLGQCSRSGEFAHRRFAHTGNQHRPGASSQRRTNVHGQLRSVFDERFQHIQTDAFIASGQRFFIVGNPGRIQGRFGHIPQHSVLAPFLQGVDTRGLTQHLGKAVQRALQIIHAPAKRRFCRIVTVHSPGAGMKRLSEEVFKAVAQKIQVLPVRLLDVPVPFRAHAIASGLVDDAQVHEVHGLAVRRSQASTDHILANVTLVVNDIHQFPTMAASSPGALYLCATVQGLLQRLPGRLGPGHIHRHFAPGPLRGIPVPQTLITVWPVHPIAVICRPLPFLDEALPAGQAILVNGHKNGPLRKSAQC